MSPPGSDDAFRIGDLIASRYRLEELLGAGPLGTVWRATHVGLGRSVALRVIGSLRVSTPAIRARFVREARVAAAFSHPGAAEIFDLGEHSGSLFVAAEVLPGRTLRTLLAEAPAPWPVERAAELAVEIAAVLAEAHLLPLVHLDLRPENVFIDDDGRPIVTDFALAALHVGLDAGSLAAEDERPDVSYVAPEVFRGDRLGPAADVYALGVMLYEMLAGSRPFEGERKALIAGHLFTPAPRLREPPARLAELVTSMLAKRAGARPSMEAVRSELAGIAPMSGRPQRVRRSGSTPSGADDSAARGQLALAIRGPIDGELLIRLMSHRIVPYVAATLRELEAADAVFAPGIDPSEVASLGARRVLTDAEPTDVERTRALFRAGVADVVARPVSAADLAARVWRAHRGSRPSP